MLMLAAFALLWRLRLRPRPIGWLFGIYLILAGAERFVIEIVRAKDDRILGPFTIAQAVSIGLVLLGAAMMGWLRQGEQLSPGPYLMRSAAA
jgi:phosphatidylglycerol---prolipoprotein diacylglyceryl transferase